MYSKKLQKLALYCKNKKNIGRIVQTSKDLFSLLKEETKFLHKDATNSERLWYVENDIYKSKKCSNCNSPYIWHQRNKILRKYCSKCSIKSKETIIKRNKTNLKKYGNICSLHGNEIKKKIIKTNFKKYGVKHASQNKEVKKKIVENNRLTLSDFLFRIKRKNDTNKYDFSKIIKYLGNKEYYVVKCKKHNIEFRYRGDNLLNGFCGCKKCHKENIENSKFIRYGNPKYNNSIQIGDTQRYSNEQAIEKCKEKHGNKYDYSLVKYFGKGDKIKIVCKEHGVFKQKAENHWNGANCPKCANSGFSQKAIEWLEHISETENIYIQHAMNDGEYKIPGTRYRVDGLCKETNTCYEFLGDKFHGNLELFEEDQIVHPYEDISVKECYKETMKRLKEIKNLGYNIEYIWENDWRNYDPSNH